MVRIMTYNTLFGGFDGDNGQRFDLQVEIIRDADPDVLLVQEWKGYLADGAKRLFEAERRLGRRALVAAARVTGQNTAILLKPGIEPISFEQDADHFHHAAAIAELRVPGLDKPLTAISVHLCPNGPHVRLREASYLVNHAIDDAYVIIGGDYNSVSPHDAEPALSELPARFRARYAGEDGKADVRTLSSLEAAGFNDIGFKLGGHQMPTVPGAAFQGSEFVPFRCDYLLATAALADQASNYRVLHDDRAGQASDHYPIICDVG
ncbi:Endonuclease/Exonuclease/phosphatase family protein [Aminobacter sp. MSH1]|uniref:endonuclease/exonuclease/phosphatase family protein n=1 Tax=Aminobacter sp. MSH1 TaxID=374606 RepID=UPI000D3509C3|nr:endonuclease/exonuclease/phosphatase family protein [Aminobacter sp. MSH1]AWC25211.1 Endonuclease/Exonuclease/phosphatase family protein [Aminobacter sp. MSH1]